MPSPTILIDNLIEETPDWRGATFAKLRKIIHDSDPEITEELKWRRPSNPMGASVWEHNGIVCVGNILKERVRLTFFAGASLPDPDNFFNARLDSRRARAIVFYEGDKPNRTALKALVIAAVEYNLAKRAPSKSRKKQDKEGQKLDAGEARPGQNSSATHALHPMRRPATRWSGPGQLGAILSSSLGRSAAWTGSQVAPDAACMGRSPGPRGQGVHCRWAAQPRSDLRQAQLRMLSAVVD